MARLSGKRIAILVADGFEQVELTSPRSVLEAEGARVLIVSPNTEQVQGWEHDEKGQTQPVDMPLAQARPQDFDALVLPGGVKNPDTLRMNEDAVRFVKHFADAGKPIAAICHGPWPLIEAEAVRGRRVTSYPSLKTDLQNAGGHWVDAEVVVDSGIVTSRNPGDLPAFNKQMIEEIAEPVYADSDHVLQPGRP